MFTKKDLVKKYIMDLPLQYYFITKSRILLKICRNEKLLHFFVYRSFISEHNISFDIFFYYKKSLKLYQNNSKWEKKRKNFSFIFCLHSPVETISKPYQLSIYYRGRFRNLISSQLSEAISLVATFWKSLKFVNNFTKSFRNITIINQICF